MKVTGLIPVLLASTALALPVDEPVGTTLERRWWSAKHGNTRGPWPQHELTYCFEKPEDEGLLKPILEAGHKMWRDAGLKEGYIELKQVPCTAEDPVALRVSYSKGQMGTTVGCGKGGNSMIFDPDFKGGFKDSTINMAHELGHAFGLMHEHQRPDAPEHVTFHCKNLKDYDDFVKKFGKKIVDEQLCTNVFQATNVGWFNAAQLVPYKEDIGFEKSTEFDMDSIMRYGSYFGAKGIIFKDKTLTDKNNKELSLASKPSALDVARINDLYIKLG